MNSLAPVLLNVTAIAGFGFGENSVRAAISAQLNELVGGQGADLVKSLLARSTDPGAGTTATLFGIVTLVATAAEVFGEMHTALNTIWKVKAPDEPFYALIRTRAASLGLVAALGFLMIVSLTASTALSAVGQYLSAAFPFVQLLLTTLNILVSLALFTLLFGAINSVLPDTPIAWRDVAMGSFVTAGRKIAERLVSRPRRTEQRLRGGRRTDRPSAVDVLLFPDFPVRRRNYQSDRRHGERARSKFASFVLCTHSINGGVSNAKGTAPFYERW